jgi:hypothetical protein
MSRLPPIAASLMNTKRPSRHGIAAAGGVTAPSIGGVVAMVFR